MWSDPISVRQQFDRLAFYCIVFDPKSVDRYKVRRYQKYRETYDAYRNLWVWSVEWMIVKLWRKTKIGKLIKFKTNRLLLGHRVRERWGKNE